MITLIVNALEKLVSTVTAGEMVGTPKQVGDKTEKEYVFSGVKFIAPRVLPIYAKIGEALSLPLKNPLKIDVKIEPLEEGVIYGRYKVTTSVPTRPAIKIGRGGLGGRR